MKILLADCRADVTSIKDGAEVSVRVFNVTDCSQTVFFVRMLRSSTRRLCYVMLGYHY